MLCILDIATIRVRPIDIFYEIRLSYVLQQEYLHFLVKHELLEESIEGRRRTYMTTEKGSKLLKHLKQAKKMLK